MKKVALSALAATVAGSLLLAPTADARPGYRGGYGYHAGYGYRHYGYRRGPGIGGALAAGAALGIIGGAIAASQAPRYYPAPAYGYGYYGPAPTITVIEIRLKQL